MKVFTLNSRVDAGAIVTTFTLKNQSVSFPAIIVGEEGRGRAQGVLPVELLPANYAKWQAGEKVQIQYAEVITTKAGKPKLRELAAPILGDACICVFRTHIGFRGGNDHTGDRTGEVKKDYFDREELVFHPFPATQTLTEGRIAQGNAGGMGSGSQLVAVMPADTVFRTGYSGRLYGGPAAHYFKYTNGSLLCATWEERELSDLF